jgi:CDGSH-type Zn-finger protein/truncated hemoglobin YjbI
MTIAPSSSVSVVGGDAAMLEASLRHDGSLAGTEALADRLRDSVLRPLASESPRLSSQPSNVESDVSELLFDLARRAAELCATDSAGAALIEASAALEELSIRLARDDTEANDRLVALTELAAGSNSRIAVADDGPYLLTNVRDVTTWLGETMPSRPHLALCRCGESAMKPLCDGTHARIGFTGAKDPNRAEDRLDTYEGVRVTISDNRGMCAHSGLCTDRLRAVFHVREEPFVTASGGRLDDIVRAVESCPSGALGRAVDGQRAADVARPARVEVSKDGPYRVTGAVPLVDAEGSDISRNAGASLEHYSLCRCGHSQNKPFCSGMHYYVNFHDPVPPADREPTLFEWAGGLPALLAMTRVFYEKYVPEDPLLSPLFVGMSPDHPQRVAAWLGEVFGGPPAYSTTYGGYDRMISQHLNKHITEAHRSRWVQLLTRSADDVGLAADPEFRAAFAAYLEWGSRLAVENSTAGAQPPPHMPMPRWWWVCDATPDARVSALAEPAVETPIELPEEDTPLSFEQHIRQCFRATDRKSMSFVFDLWSYDAVAAHSATILQRLQDGSMPCDGPWPAERIALFERWHLSGKPQ